MSCESIGFVAKEQTKNKQIKNCCWPSPISWMGGHLIYSLHVSTTVQISFPDSPARNAYSVEQSEIAGAHILSAQWHNFIPFGLLSSRRGPWAVHRGFRRVIDTHTARCHSITQGKPFFINRAHIGKREWKKDVMRGVPIRLISSVCKWIIIRSNFVNISSKTCWDEGDCRRQKNWCQFALKASKQQHAKINWIFIKYSSLIKE